MPKQDSRRSARCSRRCRDHSETQSPRPHRPLSRGLPSRSRCCKRSNPSSRRGTPNCILPGLRSHRRLGTSPRRYTCPGPPSLALTCHPPSALDWKGRQPLLYHRLNYHLISAPLHIPKRSTLLNTYHTGSSLRHLWTGYFSPLPAGSIEPDRSRRSGSRPLHRCPLHIGSTNRPLHKPTGQLLVNRGRMRYWDSWEVHIPRSSCGPSLPHRKRAEKYHFDSHPG